MIVEKGGKYLSSDTSDISEDSSFRYHRCENPKSRSFGCPDFVLTDTRIPVFLCLMCMVGRMTDPLSGDRHSRLMCMVGRMTDPLSEDRHSRLMCMVGRMTDPLSRDRHSCLIVVAIFQAFTL